MRNLIRTEIYRCQHSRLFWAALCAAFLAGGFFGLTVVNDNSFDDMFVVPLFAILAVFLSLSIGREYSDGTIRNKIIAGKTKTMFYFSRLVISLAVSAVMTAAFLIAFAAIAAKPVLSQLPASLLYSVLLGFFLLNFAWATLFTFISTLIASREIASMLNVILIIAIMFGAYQLEFMTNQPEFIQVEEASNVPVTPEEAKQIQNHTFAGSYSYTINEDGVFTYYKTIIDPTKKHPNPHYISEPLNTILVNIDYTLPHGQINLYVSCLTDHLYREIPADDYASTEYAIIAWYPLYSFGLIAVLSVSGWLLFRKKNLK